MKFSYVITAFDAENLALSVAYSDGGAANIPLTAPLPMTEADVDEIVKQYTSSEAQILAAQAAAPADLLFIEGMINVEREADRVQARGLEPPLPPSQNDLIKAQIVELEATQHRAMREHVLGDPDAAARLQSIENEIVTLRAQLT